MRIEDVKQWQCGNGLAVAENPYHKLHQIEWGVGNWETLPKWTEFEDWRLKPANQPVTDLNGIFNSEQVKEVWEYFDNEDSVWREANNYHINTVANDNPIFEKFSEYYHTTRRRLVPVEAALCNTDSSPEVIVSKIESPAQITIGDTSFTKLADGFIQILTKNGCVELVPEEIEQLYEFIKSSTTNKPPIEVPSCWCECGKHACAQHDCPCFMEQWRDDEL